MKKQYKFSIWYAILGIWLVVLMHNALVSMFAVRSIPYSEFLQLVNDQKVEEVAITDNMIQGKLIAGETSTGGSPLFRTVRVDKDISSVLSQNGGLTGSMFYMSTFAMLFLYVPQLRGPMMIFTKVGRMSLTCYLLHSIIGTVLFLRYGFGLADHIQSAGTFMFSLAVYFVLMIFSTLWLRRFKYGPMELIWRKLTYGKLNGSPKATPLHSEKSIQK